MTANPVTGFALWYDGRSGNYKNIGSYFPDFAMKINQNIVNIGGNNDSATVYVSVPAVKLYSNKAKFTATVSPTPAQGNFIFRFKNKTANVNQDSLTSYPDSLRFTIRSSGGITQGAYTVTVQGNGPNGTPVHRRTITVNVGPTGIVNIGGEVPSAFSLSQNYPNPFNPTTNIKFDVPKSGNVKLNVYDMSGKVVQELVNTALNAGAYSILLNAVNLSSGTYFYRLESEGYTDTKKLVLIK